MRRFFRAHIFLVLLSALFVSSSVSISACGEAPTTIVFAPVYLGQDRVALVEALSVVGYSVGLEDAVLVGVPLFNGNQGIGSQMDVERFDWIYGLEESLNRVLNQPITFIKLKGTRWCHEGDCQTLILHQHKDGSFRVTDAFLSDGAFSYGDGFSVDEFGIVLHGRIKTRCGLVPRNFSVPRDF